MPAPEDPRLAGIQSYGTFNQGELDAYVSFAYNVGATNFCGSTLVKKLNAYDYAGACAEMKRWVYQKKKKLPGLVTRREREYQMCMKGQE